MRYSFHAALPEVKLNADYAIISASAAGCAASEAVLHLATGSCPEFCLQPDSAGSWWRVDLAALYWMTHIHLSGGGLQNLTHNVVLRSATNDNDELVDQDYKVKIIEKKIRIVNESSMKPKWIEYDRIEQTFLKIKKKKTKSVQK